MPARVGHAVLKWALAVMHGRRFSKLLEAAKSPDDTQAAVLEGILATNAETAFGRRHGFARIGSVADYRRAVPVQTYEDLRDDIERQEFTGERRLTRESPVYYNRTSGTVAAPKNIPMTRTGLGHIKVHQRLAAYALSRGPPVMAGKVFAVSGAAIEGHLPGGTPFGSASGLLYRNQPKLLRSRYVLPAELSDIEDYETRYLAMAVLGVAEPRVTCAATANASTFVRLLDLINRHAGAILDAVAAGQLPHGIASGGVSGFKRNPRRAARLQARIDTAGSLTYADIWPDLAGVVTWTGGSCGVALRNLEPSLPIDCAIVELGYVASEVHGTVNIDSNRNVCLPALQDTFFEFAEREAREAGGAELLALGELEDGRDYYVIVTTSDGLYRYDMNDIVRVTGRVNETPALAFVQKGNGVTSITGEKLYEAQVLEAVSAVLADRDIGSHFFIMLADQELAGYTLYIETRGAGAEGESDLAAAIDARLRSVNVEYDGKRASGRLGPMRVRRLGDGAGEAYRAHRVASGQRDAQFKYLHLQYTHECAFDLGAFTVGD